MTTMTMTMIKEPCYVLSDDDDEFIAEVARLFIRSGVSFSYNYCAAGNRLIIQASYNIVKAVCDVVDENLAHHNNIDRR